MKKIFLLFFIAAALGSCTSYKNVPYMQDIETVNNSTQNLTLYDARIMPKDLLSITKSIFLSSEESKLGDLPRTKLKTSSANS